MKFLVYSDMHFRKKEEVNEFFENVKKVNGNLNQYVLILAGDIFDRVWRNDGNMKNYVRQSLFYISFLFKEVFYVMGNHEYFRYNENFDYIDLEVSLNLFKEECKKANINLLYRDHFGYLEGEEENYEIIGCTLWVHEKEENYHLSSNYRGVTSDINVIRNENKKDIEFLTKEHNKWWIGKGKKVKRIVITHHPPSMQCIKPSSIENKERYGNDLPVSSFKDIDVWICGHIHSFSDFQIENTRIILNPLGTRKDLHPLKYEFFSF